MSVLFWRCSIEAQAQLPPNFKMSPGEILSLLCSISSHVAVVHSLQPVVVAEAAIAFGFCSFCRLLGYTNVKYLVAGWRLEAKRGSLLRLCT